ncbi:MAG: DUF3592 domain-containing protein [Magnetococcales bacterium]|nr:DUF3592 domain-containing protein [Magnetococcales bacterium]
MGYKFFHFLRNFAVLLGLTFLILSMYPFIQYHKTSDWPSVPAKITHSQLRNGGAIFLGIGTIYHADIKFIYEVEGKKIPGNRVQYGIGGKNYIFKRFAEGIVERYPVGKVTAVYYNPENPTDEIIESAPVLGFSFVWIVLTVMFFSLAVILTVRKSDARIDRKHKKYSLRPKEGEGNSDLVDFYPTQIYNPQNSEQQLQFSNIQEATKKRVNSDPNRSTVLQEFAGDYPSQIYQPSSSNEKNKKKLFKEISLTIPFVGLKLTLTLAKE